MSKKVFGNDTKSQPWVYEWYKCFQECQEDIKDNTKSGCPNMSMSINDENIETTSL